MVGKGYNKDQLGNIRRDDWESLTPTIYGWGVNDVNYNTAKRIELPHINGKRRSKGVWVCPYYDDWVGVIERCFCSKFKTKWPTYQDCTLTEDWKYLSNFIKWVDSQPNKDWKSCALDKDLLVTGNKFYGLETDEEYAIRMENEAEFNKFQKEKELHLLAELKAKYGEV